MTSFPQGLSGWLDYDRHHLPSLDAAERIDYFEARVTKVFLRPLRELYAKMGSEGPNSSSLLILGMTACCGVEALGRFAGGSSLLCGQRFHAFAKDYMSPDLQTAFESTTRAEVLWDCFRNGLAHGFAIKHGGFEENGVYFSVKSDAGYDVLQVSPSMLIADIEAGFAKFIAKLRAEAPSGSFSIFDSEFTTVFVDGG